MSVSERSINRSIPSQLSPLSTGAGVLNHEVFLEKILHYSARSQKRMRELSTVTRSWDDVVCNSPRAWKNLVADPTNCSINGILRWVSKVSPNDRAACYNSILAIGEVVEIEKRDQKAALWLRKALESKVILDPNGKDLQSHPLIYQAALEGNGQAVHCLRRAGADPNALVSKGHPIVADAILRHSETALELLIEAGANPNAKVNSKVPLLCFLSSLNCDPQVVEIFSRYVKRPFAQDDRGRSPILCASSAGQFETVEILLDQGCNLGEELWDAYHDGCRTAIEVLETILFEREAQRETLVGGHLFRIVCGAIRNGEIRILERLFELLEMRVRGRDPKKTKILSKMGELVKDPLLIQVTRNLAARPVEYEEQRKKIKALLKDKLNIDLDQLLSSEDGQSA